VTLHPVHKKRPSNHLYFSGLGAIWRAGVFALLYFLIARASLAFIVQPQGIAAVWPPSGLLLAALLLSNRRSWPLLLLLVAGGITLANLFSGNSWVVSLGFALANIIESLLAAEFSARVIGLPITMTRLRDVVGLAGLAVIGCNALTALLGAAVASLAFGAPFWDVWRVWWIADGLGMLVIGAVILTWAADHAAPRRPPVARMAVY
jgi:integral membrane sensor domain MASE1